MKEKAFYDKLEGNSELKKFYNADSEPKDQQLTFEQWKPLAEGISIYPNITDPDLQKIFDE